MSAAKKKAAKKVPSKNGKHKTVKIRNETYTNLQELVVIIAQKGWGPAGANRAEGASQVTVIDEALLQLKAKIESA